MASPPMPWLDSGQHGDVTSVSAPHPTRVARMLVELARRELESARYVDALQHAGAARALAASLPASEEIELRLIFAACARVMGLAERSLDDGLAALRLAGVLEDSARAGRAQLQLAQTYRALGDPARATAELEQALRLALDVDTRGAVLVELGGLRLETGETAAAATLATAAARLATAAGGAAWQAGAYLLRARLALVAGAPSEAEHRLRDARRVIGAHGGPWRLEVALHAGHVARAIGDDASARARYHEVRRRAEAAGARHLVAAARLALYALAKEAGDLAEALAQYELYHAASLPDLQAAARDLRADTIEQAVATDGRDRDAPEWECAQIATLQRLAVAAERRDANAAAHFERVGDLAAGIAAELGLPAYRVEMLRLAARLHDIGKIGIPDRILLNPGPLDPDDRHTVEQHTRIGAEILGRGAGVLRVAEEVALTHHERYDGRGYPNALAGEAIPLTGRIVAVVDVFDALTSERPYKPAWSVDAALAEVVAGAGSQFDPHVVEVFARLAPAAWTA